MINKKLASEAKAYAKRIFCDVDDTLIRYDDKIPPNQFMGLKPDTWKANKALIEPILAQSLKFCIDFYFASINV